MIHLTNEISRIDDYLRERKFLGENELIEKAEKPGEGNMNFTLRLKTNQRSFIIKQSRDYVEKYPQVAAPKERIISEASFYNLISENSDLDAKMPRIMDLDKENKVLLMEDLGESNDFTFLYEEGKNIDEPDLISIMNYAVRLHNGINEKNVVDPIRNREMRKLNHEHIFLYPFMEDNGLNLDEVLPGLKKVAKTYQSSDKLKSKVEKLGTVYLQDGPKLLHGDYFPGSWLKTKRGIRIIDPEFCFFGYPEFEMGVCKAHLRMANQDKELIKKGLDYYLDRAPLNLELMNSFFAIEVMRRILGLAQLPLEINLDQRASLLAEAEEILMK